MTTAAPGLPFASLNGFRVVKATLRVPGRGAWIADVALDVVPPVAMPTAPFSGLLQLGDLSLVGTILPAATGSFGQQQWYRIVGGGGGWSKTLAPRGYHNDVGILASQVILDAGLEVGELVEVLDGDHVLDGVDFVREAGPASRLIGQLFDDGVGWWVGYDGQTKIGARPAPDIDPSLVLELLDYYPAKRVAVFATETPSAIQIGQTIQAPQLTTALTVRELELELDGGPLRIRAWVDEAGATGALDNRLLRALRGLVREMLPKQTFLGPVRYRVVQMNAGRVDLQVVEPKTGLPDLQLVKMVPGVAGVATELALGGVVLVQFIEGQPSMPVITHYAPTDDAAFLPVKVTVGGPDVELGADGGSPVALAPAIQTWTTAATAALTAIAGVLNAPGVVHGAPGTVPPTPDLDASVAATKVKAT